MRTMSYRKRIALLMLALLLAASAAESLIDPSKGLVGLVEIGDTRATVVGRLGKPIAENDLHAVFADGDIIATFKFPKDSVERVTILSKAYQTKKGIHVGSPMNKVLKAYGKDGRVGSVSVPYHNVQAVSVSYEVDKHILRFLSDGSNPTKGKVYAIEVEEDWASF